MVKTVDVPLSQLDCTNLRGLRANLDPDKDKLTRVLKAYESQPPGSDNHGTGPIDLRPNPVSPGRFLVLNGHHRSAAAGLMGEDKVKAIVYDESEADRIPDPVSRRNFKEAPANHNVAAAKGLGRVADLLEDNVISAVRQRLKGR